VKLAHSVPVLHQMQKLGKSAPLAAIDVIETTNDSFERVA
jgi:phage-related protein